MDILLTIVFGAFVGWIASIITKRDAEQGWLANIVVGVVGSLIGNFIGRALGLGTSGFSILGVLLGIAGAVVLCVILNLVTRKRVR